MRVLEAMGRIVQLGGAPERAARVAEMRAGFEERTGAFAPDDDWFEERSRAFWCDAVTRTKFGREVEHELGDDVREWLAPIERAHRGLFRAERAERTESAALGVVLVDAWSGAELAVNVVDDASRAELAAATGQLFDARVAGSDGSQRSPVGRQEAAGTLVVALLPGAVFHPRDATEAITSVLAAAHARSLSTHDVLDALLRMQRTLRSLSRVKAAYAYRADALSPRAVTVPARRGAKSPA